MAERLRDRPVTILFSDVEGSTALHSARGDSGAQEVLGSCDRLIRRQVREHGGRTVKSLGDGLLAVFGSPRKAVECALAIQQVVTRHGHEHPHQQVSVKVGVHAGEVSETSGDVLGSAVNAAARICARARGGEVLVSEVVRQLCATAPGTAFTERGRVVLKGFPERWRLYGACTGEAGRPSGEGQTPFVGRVSERAELRALMRRGLTGRGGLVMIGGEPGVGKTRLTEALADEARQLGYHAAVGHCYEGQGDLPYMPWVEIVEAAAQETPRALFRQVLGDSAPEMALIVPRLRRMFDDIPPPLELPPDQRRRYFFASTRDYITRVAARRPQLLILEDVHWADESTLLFLEHLAEVLPASPIVVICTFRDPPVDISPALAQALSALVRRQAHILTLGCHSDAEVAAMLAALTGHPPPPALTEAIYGETEGNALFVEEVFRHLVDTGAVLDAGGRFRTDLRLEELQLPENLRLVIGRRLDRLGATARRMLSVAAVIGRRFSFEVLEAADDVDAGVLLDAVDEAQRAGMIGPCAHDQAELSFSHELIRQALLARLSTPRRQRSHLRVANAIERVAGDDARDRAADIAHHLVQAGPVADPLRTAEHLTLAGERALTATAFEEALRHFTSALEVLPRDRMRHRADLLLKVGLAQRSLSRWDDTVATWRDALPALESLGDVEGVAELCYELSYHLGWAYRMPESLAVARRGLTAVGEMQGPHRIRLLAVAAAGLTMSNRFEEADEHLTQVARLTPDGADPGLLGEIGFVELFHKYSTMQLRDAIEPGRRAETALRGARSPWHLAGVLAFVNVAAVFQGRFEESDAIEAELYPLADRLGHMGATAVARRSEFPKAAARHADMVALDALSRMQSEAAASMGAGWLAHAETLRGIVDFWHGDWPAARTHMEEAAAMTVSPSWFGPQHGYLMLLRAFAGERDEALSILFDVSESLPRRGRPNSIGPWTLAILAAEAVGLIGDRDAALVLYPLVSEALATGTLMRQYDGRLIETAAGMVAASAGLPGAAEEHFENALRRADELPHLMERPHVRHFYARFLLERSSQADEERIRALVQEAVAGYRAIGMPRHEAMASALVTRLELRGRLRAQAG